MRTSWLRSDIHVVDVETRAVTAITRGPMSSFVVPVWMPDGESIAALGHRFTGGAGSRNDVWLFAADGSDATPDGGRNISASHDLMPGLRDEQRRHPGRADLASCPRRRASLFLTAPRDGAYELWRLASMTAGWSA